MAHAAARLSRVLSFEESNLPATSEPIIHAANAAAFMPPSLNAFRTKASRAAPDCAPAVWYKMSASTLLLEAQALQRVTSRRRTMCARSTLATAIQPMPPLLLYGCLPAHHVRGLAA